MKTLAADALPDLPSEIKDLIQDGVYALYSLRQSVGKGGIYLLVTRGQEFYVLSSEGSVVGADGSPDISAFDIENVITFNVARNSVFINHA